VNTSTVYAWCYPRNRRLNQRKRHSVWRILRQIAEPIGRADTIGRPWLWRLKSPLESRVADGMSATVY
jgi:hypothetical protein